MGRRYVLPWWVPWGGFGSIIFCNKEQKNECLLEVLVFDLRGVVSILSKSPNMGTTEIRDNGKILRTETGFTYLITHEGISSGAIKSDELIKAIREIFF